MLLLNRPLGGWPRSAFRRQKKSLDKSSFIVYTAVVTIMTRLANLVSRHEVEAQGAWPDERKGGSMPIPMSHARRKRIDSILDQNGLVEHKWIDPLKIVISQWVRFKCMFGCGDYGGASCPPHVPSINECRAFIHEYRRAVMIRFTKTSSDPAERNEWAKQSNLTMLKVEKEIFVDGYPKVFLLMMSTCNLCVSCVKDRTRCKNPRQSRPTPEGLGIDVFATAKKYRFPIKVLRDHSEEMNRYALLMID